MKLIGGGLLRDRATPFYSRLGILKLPNLFKLEAGKFVYAHFKNDLSLSLSDYFILTREVSQSITRSTQSRKNCLYTPHYASNRWQKCIGYQGVKIWNDTPTDIQNSS